MNRMKPTCLLITALALFALTPSAMANLIIADDASDDVINNGNCSLREAIIAANTNATVDQCGAGSPIDTDLLFAIIGGSELVIELDSPLVIEGGVEIIGPGIDDLLLIPNGAESAFELDMAQLDDDFILRGMRIGGFSESAIVVISANDVTLDQVRFASNSSSMKGGAFSAFSSNFPGGTTDFLGSLTVTDSEFVQNSSDDDGGAIAVWANAPVTIDATLFDGNLTGGDGGALYGGITNQALLVTNSTFLNNGVSNTASTTTGGGAIDSTYAATTISGSFFSSNFAADGGAIRLTPPSGASNPIRTISNSTFTENDTPLSSAAVLARGTSAGELRLNFNTFSGNQGFSVETWSGQTSRVKGNLFLDNAGGDCIPSGPWFSEGHNIETNGDTCLGHANDLSNVAVDVLPVGDYGGPTQTIPPYPDSVAVDLGATVCTAAGGGSNITQDQRGEPRPRDGNASGGVGQCDSGAFEWPNAELLLISFDGDGEGAVVSDEYGIECLSPMSCGWPLPEGETFNFTASPDINNSFEGWDGSCSGTGNCQVTMSGFRSISAEFMSLITPVTLTVVKNEMAANVDATIVSAPAGIDCGAACIADFNENDMVTLTATEQLGSLVTGWAGCDSVSGDGLQCDLTITANRTVVADIDEDPDFIFASNFGN